MKNQTIVAIIWVAEAIVFLAVLINLQPLLYRSPIDYWLTVALLLAVTGVVLVKSFRLPQAGKMQQAFLFGNSYHFTVVTSSVYDALLEEGWEEVPEGTDEHPFPHLTDNEGGVVTTFKWFLVPWPFVPVFKEPSDIFEIPVHAGDIFTHSPVKANEDDNPRVSLKLDATLQIRLNPNPLKRADDLGLYDNFWEQDLTKLVDMHLDQNGLEMQSPHTATATEEQKQVAIHRHEVPLIALKLHRTLNNPTLQALRSAAAEFTFTGDADIINNREKFEKAVHKRMVQDGSAFVHGGFLKKDAEEEAQSGRTVRPDGFDVVIELVKPLNKELADAIDYAYVGKQEGKREQAKEHLRRLGIAQGLEAIANKLNLGEDKTAAYLMEALKEGNVSFRLYGGGGVDTVVDYLKDYIRSKKINP